MSELLATDKSPVDAWTLAHFASGFLSGMLGIPLWLVVMGAIAWEIVENWNRPYETIPHMSPDSNINAVADVIATMIGFFAAVKFKAARLVAA